MPISYVSDVSGNPIAVQIPIEEWNILKESYPEIDMLKEEPSIYNKQMIDDRLQAIANNPNRLRPVEELFGELDKTV